MKISLLTPALFGLLALAPAAAAQDAPATCAVQAQALRATVESDYIGYRLAQRNDTARAEAMGAAGVRLESEAAASDSAGCLAVMWRYIAAFNDPHLFLADTPSEAGDLFSAAAPTDLRARPGCRHAGYAVRPVVGRQARSGGDPW